MVLVEKELLEIPDDEIRFLPIRDLLRLVDYKEWLEVKNSLLSFWMTLFSFLFCSFSCLATTIHLAWSE